MDLSEKELKAILEALTTAHTYLYKDWTSECEFPALSEKEYKDWTSECEFPALSEKEYNDLISRFENNIHSHFSKRASIRDD